MAVTPFREIRRPEKTFHATKWCKELATNESIQSVTKPALVRVGALFGRALVDSGTSLQREHRTNLKGVVELQVICPERRKGPEGYSEDISDGAPRKGP